MKLGRFFLAIVVSLAPLVAGAQPVRVFILAGQSNMQGHAQVRTFAHLGMDPASRPLLDEMQNFDGSPRVCERVWISSIGCAKTEQTGRLTTGFGAEGNGPKIGPEFTFGITMEKFMDGPILLIKTAWGGKSLNTDFRPPSAGPYVFSDKQLDSFRKQGRDLSAIEAEKALATGVNYRLMIEHVRGVLSDPGRVIPGYDPAQGIELAGFVWFQGWNDMVDTGSYPNRDKSGGYDAYSEALAHFIRDVRKDLNAPQLPFVIGVIGVGGPVEEFGPDQQRYRAIHQNFRLAMAAPAELPEFIGNVVAIRTETYWDRELATAKAKENAIQESAKQLARDGSLGSDEEKVLRKKMRAEGLTERERQLLDNGISNLEFHYLGSAKILGGIGKGLAEAMAELRQIGKQPQP